MNSEDRLRDALRGLESPPVPREGMWRAIEAELRGERQAAAAPRREARRGTWALACALVVVGIIVGRATVTERDDRQSGQATTRSDAPRRDSPALREATRQVLDRASTRLTEYRTAAAVEIPRDEMAAWSRTLLTDTRLLMDSPAGDDEELRAILLDLELVLARLVSLSIEPEAEDDGAKQVLEAQVRENGLLLRMQEWNTADANPRAHTGLQSTGRDVQRSI